MSIHILRACKHDCGEWFSHGRQGCVQVCWEGDCVSILIGRKLSE